MRLSQPWILDQFHFLLLSKVSVEMTWQSCCPTLLTLWSRSGHCAQSLFFFQFIFFFRCSFFLPRCQNNCQKFLAWLSLFFFFGELAGYLLKDQAEKEKKKKKKKKLRFRASGVPTESLSPLPLVSSQYILPSCASSFRNHPSQFLPLLASQDKWQLSHDCPVWGAGDEKRKMKKNVGSLRPRWFSGYLSAFWSKQVSRLEQPIQSALWPVCRKHRPPANVRAQRHLLSAVQVEKQRAPLRTLIRWGLAASCVYYCCCFFFWGGGGVCQRPWGPGTHLKGPGPFFEDFVRMDHAGNGPSHRVWQSFLCLFPSLSLSLSLFLWACGLSAERSSCCQLKRRRRKRRKEEEEKKSWDFELVAFPQSRFSPSPLFLLNTYCYLVHLVLEITHLNFCLCWLAKINDNWAMIVPFEGLEDEKRKMKKNVGSLRPRWFSGCLSAFWSKQVSRLEQPIQSALWPVCRKHRPPANVRAQCHLLSAVQVEKTKGTTGHFDSMRLGSLLCLLLLLLFWGGSVNDHEDLALT